MTHTKTTIISDKMTKRGCAEGARLLLISCTRVIAARPGPAWPGLARLGPAWPGLARPGPAWHPLRWDNTGQSGFRCEGRKAAVPSASHFFLLLF